MAQFTALNLELDFTIYYSRIVPQATTPSIAAMVPLVDAALRSLIADKLAKRAPMVFARGCLKRVANHSQHFEELGRTLCKFAARTDDMDMKKAFETLAIDTDLDEPWKRLQLPLWKYTTHRLYITPVKRDLHEITLETHDEEVSSDEMEADDVFMDDSNSEYPDSEDDDEFPFSELDTPQTAYVPTPSQSVSAPATQFPLPDSQPIVNLDDDEFFVFSDDEDALHGPFSQPLKKRPKLSPSSKVYEGTQALIQRQPLNELKNTTFDEAIDEAEFPFSDAEMDEIQDEDDIMSELNE
ncbi:hypothetical protein SAICODRAFT_71336 [Saitoella complicata NRRL Y-17804]|nr:uncharacterized protein SAICODRAFT_71336 [Saitoella complicata NRRL Y-17804]ODQ52908.1 hypothetical protein SAICODRAFT_71336 [Saitoella complicata NRRL Y-17804]